MSQKVLSQQYIVLSTGSIPGVTAPYFVMQEIGCTNVFRVTCISPGMPGGTVGSIYTYNGSVFLPVNGVSQTLQPYDPIPSCNCVLNASANVSPAQFSLGSSVTLSASATGGSGVVSSSGGNYNYNWSHGLGSGQSKTITPTTTTTYTVTVTDASISGCTPGIASVTVDVCSGLNFNTNNSNLPLSQGSSRIITASAYNGSGNYSYDWSNGLGNGASKTVSPLSTTTYYITVTDNVTGCTKTGWTTVNVSTAPPCNPPTNAGSISVSPTTASLGSTFSISNIPNGGSGGSYEYRFEYSYNNVQWTSFTSWTSNSSATFTPTATGTYYIRRAVRRNCGSSILYTSIKTINVNSSCNNISNGGSISGDESNCNSYDPTIIISSSSPSGGSGSTQYQWQLRTASTWQNITSSGANNASYNPPTIFTTTQYRRGARRSGCSTYIYSNTITKAVTSAPTVNAGTDQTITQGGSATLMASATGGTGGYIYSWNNGLGNGATKTVSPASTTTYTVTVTDASGCTHTDNLTITVISCNLTANTGINKTICTGTSTTLTATASNGTAPYIFTWNNGLGNGASKTVSPISTITYIVTATDANNCTDTSHVTVFVSPLPNATTSKTDAICGLNTGTITFTFPDEPTQTSIAFSYDGGNTYQTAVADNSTSVTYTGFAAGTYSLYAKWGDNSCSTALGSIPIGSNNDPTFCNPSFDFQKSLLEDTVRMGETVFYTFTFINNSGVVLSNVQFTDNLSNNALFFSDAMNETGGIQVVGNTLNSSAANLMLNNIPIGTSSFQLAVDIPNGLTAGSSYCNQAQISNLQVSHPNLPDSISSNNPNTPTSNDATCVVLKVYENCCNGIDDDKDGLCDKDDPDCN